MRQVRQQKYVFLKKKNVKFNFRRYWVACTNLMQLKHSKHLGQAFAVQMFLTIKSLSKITAFISKWDIEATRQKLDLQNTAYCSFLETVESRTLKVQQ